MDSDIAPTCSLPCLSEKDVKRNFSTRYKLGKKAKNLAVVSEPLLSLAQVTDGQKSEEKVLKHCESDADQEVTVACKDTLLLSKGKGASSPSLEYCFFCSQRGPVIKEKVCDGQKSKGETKSQSLQMLNSFGSSSTGAPCSQAKSCENLTDTRLSPVLVLKSATLKTQHKGRKGSEEQSISSLSKGTEIRESCGLMCRICHGGFEEGDLIRPCKCTGTVKHAHQSCILNWVSKSGHQSCEICKFKFRTQKQSVKCFWKWKFPEVSTKGWLHIGLFIAFATMLLTSITWIIWSRVSKTPSAIAERTTEEVKFAYMVNGLFIALAVGGLYFDSLKHFKQYSKRWGALNQNVVVECYMSENESKVEGVGASCSSDKPQQSFVSMAAEETETNRLSVQPESHGTARRNDPTAWV